MPVRGTRARATRSSASNALARDGIGEQTSTSSRPLIELRARAPPTAARRARAGRRLRADAASARGDVGAGSDVRAATRERRATVVAQPIGVDVEPARELHDVLVAHEIVRVLGDDRRRRLAGARAPLERRRGRRPRARGRAGTRRNGVAPFDRARRALRDRRCQTSAGSRPGREVGDLELHLVTLLPLVATSRPRAWPAASASYASITLRARFFRIRKCSSASAVPHVATAFGTPASANAMTSV